jgi:hypothetical protein
MRWLGDVLRIAPNRTPKVALHWTPPGKSKNMEDNYIRAGGNGLYYGPGSVRCKGQRKMSANC